MSIVTLSKKKVPLVTIHLTIRKIDRRGGEGNVGKNMMQTIRSSQNFSEHLRSSQNISELFRTSQKFSGLFRTSQNSFWRERTEEQAEVRNGATNFGSHVLGCTTEIGWKAFFSVYFALTHSKVNKSNVSIGIKNNVVKFEISVDWK